MTYSCEHIKKAHSLIKDAIDLSINKNIMPPEEGGMSGTFSLGVNRMVKMFDNIRILKEEILDKLNEAEKIINSCNCLQKEKQVKLESEKRLNDQIVSLTKELKSLQETSYREKNALNQRISNLESSEKKLQGEVSSLNRKINSLSTESNKNKQEIDRLKKVEVELKKDCSTLGNKVASLQKDLSQFQRSIILIGNTGSGKSTLANVLINKEGVFKESGGSVSQTKEVQVEEFVAENGIKYRIVDIIGFNDTKLSSEEIIKKVKESTFEGDYNLNQVLFTFNGRFENKEKEIFEILSNDIFDENIMRYTTIVRTNFPKFYIEDACEEDRKNLRNENKEYEEIINGVNKIIYVDNPSLEGLDFVVESNKKLREMSRKKILDHLLMNCPENYRPQNEEELVAQIETTRAFISR